MRGLRDAARFVALALSTLIALGLLFAMLYIQARETGMSHKRQLYYGELERVQSQLRDWTDVLRVRVESHGQQKSAFVPVESPVRIEEFVKGVTSNDPRRLSQPWCEKLAGQAGKPQLSFLGQQQRDGRIMLAIAEGKDEKTGNPLACSRINIAAVLDSGDGRSSPADLAIARDGEIKLVLRGDAGWPPSTDLALANIPEAARIAVGKSGSAKDAEVLARENRPQVRPVEVRIAGEDWLLYAFPLDIGRTVSFGGADGDCAPRQCMLLALGRAPGWSDGLDEIAPLTRLSFALLAVLVLLLIPVLKLKTIDQNGAMHWTDAAAIVGSLPLAIAVLLSLLTSHSHWQSERATRDRLAAQLSGQIARELDQEVRVSIKETWELGHCASTDTRQVGDDQRLTGAVTGCPENSVAQTLPMSSVGLRRVSDSKLLKAYQLAEFNPARRIEDRAYFRQLAARDGLMPLTGWVAGRDPGNTSYQTPIRDWSYLVAQVPTVIDGISRMVVGLRYKDQFDCDHAVAARLASSSKTAPETHAEDCFLLGAKQLATTMSRPMPVGFGFAVLDARSHEVLQHSDSRRVHSEHFDEQLDDPAILKQAQSDAAAECVAKGRGSFVEAHALAPVEVRYGGSKVALTLRPICSTGWIMAVWHDRTDGQLRATSPALLALGFVAFVALVAALILLVMGQLKRDALVRFIWPRSADPDTETADEIEQNRATGGRLCAILPALVVMLGVPLFLLHGYAAKAHALVVLLVTMAMFARAFGGDWPVWGALFGTAAVIARFAASHSWHDRPAMTLAYGLVTFAALILIWRYVEIGDWVCRTLGLAVRTVRKSPRRWGPIGSILELPLRPGIDRVADRNRPALRVQRWSIVLIAVLPALFVYRAGWDVLGDARVEQNLSAAQSAQAQFREEAGELYRSHYIFGPEAAKQARYGWDESQAVSGKAPRYFVNGFCNAPSCSWRNPLGPIDLAEPRGSKKAPFHDQVTSLMGIVADIGGYHAQARPDAGDETARSNSLESWARSVKDNATAVNPEPTAIDKITWKKLKLSLHSAQPWVADFGKTGEHPAGERETVNQLAMARIVLTVLASLLALVGFALVLTRIVNHGLFGIQHFGFRSLHPTRHAADMVDTANASPKMLLIDFPWRDLTDLKANLERKNGYTLLNLGTIRDEMAELPNAKLTSKPWIVVGFESVISNRTLRQKALNLLERIAERDEARIYFFSEMSPMSRLKHQRERERQERLEAGGHERTFESEAFRWADLFEDFVTFHFQGLSAPDLEPSQKLDKLFGEGTTEWTRLKAWAKSSPELSTEIDRELATIPSDRVQKQRATFATLPGEQAVSPQTLTIEQIHEYLANFLGDYYQRQWVRSSREEHLVMYHLAHGHFINAANFTVINNLLTRRLIRRDPDFRLMNESFAYWIRTLEHPRWFASYRAEVERGSVWHMLRFPVAMVAIGAALAIAYIDQGGTGSILSLVPAFAAAIPLMLSRFNQTKQQLMA